jgi:BioD-like phosphotransacetylase family protein
MKTIYITSTEDFGGKTCLVIGLGQHLQRDGYAVGYMKPLSTSTRQVEGESVDRDAGFVRQQLALEEPLADIIPITLTPSLLQDAIQAAQSGRFQAAFQEAYERVAQGKEILLLEGGRHPFEGASLNLASPQIAERLDARVLTVVKYSDNLSIDRAASLRTIYGDRLLGIVINAVPRPHMRLVQETGRPFLEQIGLPVLAVLPQERLLLAISVQELVDHLGGEVLCCPDQTGGLVEYMMVGAMRARSAISYFRRRPNKAVITGGDRPGIQLAALETSTRCLILTGNQRPPAEVMNRAQELDVPIVLVKQDTLTTVRSVDQIFGKTSLHQPKKCARFFGILQERFDFARLYDMMNR